MFADTQNLTGHSPEQPAIVDPVLSRAWTRHPPKFPSNLNVSVILWLPSQSLFQVFDVFCNRKSNKLCQQTLAAGNAELIARITPASWSEWEFLCQGLANVNIIVAEWSSSLGYLPDFLTSLKNTDMVSTLIRAACGSSRRSSLQWWLRLCHRLCCTKRATDALALQKIILWQTCARCRKELWSGYGAPIGEAWENWPPCILRKTISSSQILLPISSLPPSPGMRSISGTFT